MATAKKPVLRMVKKPKKTKAQLHAEWQKKAVEAVAEAIKAAVVVDNSNEALHQRLTCMVLTARQGEKKDTPGVGWDIISEYVRSRKDWMVSPKEQTLVTASVQAWLKDVCNLDINRQGTVSQKKDTDLMKDYGTAWRKHLENMPWFKLARQMQLFKWTDYTKAVESFAKAIAQNQYLGEEIDFSKLGELVEEEVAAQKRNKRFKEWQSKAVEAAKKKGLEDVSLLREVAEG